MLVRARMASSSISAAIRAKKLKHQIVPLRFRVSTVSNMPSLRPRISTAAPILSDVMHRISTTDSQSLIAHRNKGSCQVLQGGSGCNC